MANRLRKAIEISEGFFPAAAETGAMRRPNSIKDGLNVILLGPSLTRSSKGLGVAFATPAPKRLYLLSGVGDGFGGVDGKGSIVPGFGNSEWYMSAAGSGSIFGRVTHSGTGGKLRYFANSTERNAGLLAPTLAPTGAAVNSVNSTGATGLNDLTASGSLTGASPAVFIVKITDAAASPDEFKFNKDGGSFSAAIPITAGVAQLLSDGVSVLFAAGNGHTLNNQWVITSSVSGGSLTATVDGSMTSGATALVITRIRTGGFLTGDAANKNIFHESNGSDPSNIVSFENKKLTVLFPAVGTGLDAHNAWGVYFTNANQGSIGPFLALMEKMKQKVIMESDLAGDRTFTFEFTDAQLLALQPPADNDPPPLGEFVAELANVKIVMNVEGGPEFQPSKAGFSEAYPPTARARLSPAEPVMGFTARPAEGELVLWTQNSIQSMQLTGNPFAPVLSRAVLPDQGIQSPHGGCFDKNSFYGFNGESGFFRLTVNGDLDLGFSLPVRDYVRDLGWDSRKVAVGYDPNTDSVVFCHEDIALAFHPSLSQAMGKPIWSPPITLNANPGAADTSTLTINGMLLIGRDGGAFFWETGTLDRTWFLVAARQDDPDPMDRKTIIGFRFSCKTPTSSTVTAKLYLDYADTNGAATAEVATTASGGRYSKWKRINKRCRNFTLRLEGTKIDERLESMEIEMIHVQGIRETQAA